jgi:hypothetical protein
MKTRITKAEARAFRKRWATVNSEQIKQLRRMSIGQKLAQLNALFEWGKYFDGGKPRANKADAVRRRWAQLRRICRG